MASTTSLFNNARQLIGGGDLDLNGGGTFKLALVSSSYTPDLDNHDYFNDITNELSTANGYTAGGATLTSVTLTKGTNKSIFSSAYVEWTASGGSIAARRAILYLSTGNTSTSALIASILLDNTPADVTATDGNKLRVTPDATNGWFYL